MAVYGGTVFFWICLSKGVEAERQRQLHQESDGLWAAGLGGLLAALCVGLATLGVALHHFHPRSALYCLIALPFAAYLYEQGLARGRTRDDLMVARDQALRAKLAPHFIFNALNTLHAQIESDPRDAQATTERLGELFRSVIEASDQPTIPLKQEVAFVEAYLGIEQARLGERLRVRMEIPEELESAGVPPLSLQVLVENAVKHGVAPLEGGGEIRITANREGGDLVIEVSDPGTGIGTRTGTGTALETLRARLGKPGDLALSRVEGRTVASFRWRQP